MLAALPVCTHSSSAFPGSVLVWMVYAGAPGRGFRRRDPHCLRFGCFDGVVARKLGVATAELRHLDSRVDLVFYATAAWAVWRVHPDVVRSIAVPGTRSSSDSMSFATFSTF